ncbi:iron-siderophore ABC transporter substrate-binding protein [Paenibacillus lycopersici]|uniref:Iron-siderophore ABC transporter substrate-binding protein n=1 Tax=Paenibacillus lycopersici TaxID=2704462 RepID=A0A6C0G715_9BACL|nr:iron-siderophore ABC transporter substrate-binding protein [Paenibacillus lycopersici]QHT62555.1 iron-siderophore ABC transporter substrate-binding protein [Paenibacillus lycopersici]
MHRQSLNDRYSKKGPRQHRMNAALLLIAVLALALVLGGCTKNGGDNASSGTSAPDAEQAAQPAPADTEKEPAPVPVKIKHDYGETTVPAAPARIVSIGMEDMLLSLDVPLVQAFSTDGYYLDAQIKEKNIPINSSFDINFEAILAAKPDLIIMNTYMTDENGYEELSKIAPTIAFVRDNWQTGIVEIGKALGKEEQAQAVLQAYQDKVKQAKAAIVQAIGEDKTVAFIRPGTKQVELDFPEYAWTSALYNDLGLSPDPKVLEFKKNTTDDWGGTMLSLEKLPDLTADYLFMDYGASMAAETDFQKDVAASSEVEKLNVWKKIPAVEKGQAYKVSARHWALNGPIADGLKIDDVVQALTGTK